MKHIIFWAYALMISSVLYAQGTSVVSMSSMMEGRVPPLFVIASDVRQHEAIDTAGSDYAYLGRVEVRANMYGAWRIVIKSVNNGKMVRNGWGNSLAYPYWLEFGATKAIDLSTDYSQDFYTDSTVITTDYAIGVRYPHSVELTDNFREAVYRDTVTIIIAAL